MRTKEYIPREGMELILLGEKTFKCCFANLLLLRGYCLKLTIAFNN